MRGLLVVISILLLSVLSASSVAQSEPQPEVDVDCVNVYEAELRAHPEQYEIRAGIECILNNQNAYQVEVETNLEWIYSEDHDEDSTVTVNGNSEIAVRFYLWVTEDAPAGIEGMTFEATVIQYAGIRECTDCETTSSSLDLTILEWTTVDLQQTSQSHQGIFGGDWVSEPCSSGAEYGLNATVTVQANHQNANAAVGFSATVAQYIDEREDVRIVDNEEFISKIPDMIRIDAGPGESSDISIAFPLQEYESLSDEIVIIFIVVYGEEYYVTDALQSADIWEYYWDGGDMLKFYFGGCYIGAEAMEYEYEEGSPIIIETSSDNSLIYLIAGVGIALTASLLVVLIVILVRRSGNN